MLWSKHTQVRRLVCVCLTRFYMHGDMVTIYGRVSSMQSILNGKDPGAQIKPISDVSGRCVAPVEGGADGRC